MLQEAFYTGWYWSLDKSQEQAYSGPYSCDQCYFVVAFLLLNVAY
ncbi:hypothetical protein CFP56_010902 [Quercus suber]|uniref:Uncharacterized protein n=1 Tax=Quercus suber TaxID=58331 RepID=A0AAW0KY12_QUESU